MKLLMASRRPRQWQCPTLLLKIFLNFTKINTFEDLSLNGSQKWPDYRTAAATAARRLGPGLGRRHGAAALASRRHCCSCLLGSWRTGQPPPLARVTA